jgi:hypothetical protein
MLWQNVPHALNNLRMVDDETRGWRKTARLAAGRASSEDRIAVGAVRKTAPGIASRWRVTPRGLKPGGDLPP